MPTPPDSDFEVEEVIQPKPTMTQPKAKAPSERAGSAKPARPVRATQSRSQKKSQPLFIESDEDEPERNQDMGVDAEDASLAAVEKEIDVQEDSQAISETLRSNPSRTQPSKPKPGSRRKDAPVLLEDSDDDMAFKGFATRRKGRR